MQITKLSSNFMSCLIFFFFIQLFLHLPVSFLFCLFLLIILFRKIIIFCRPSNARNLACWPTWPTNFQSWSKTLSLSAYEASEQPVYTSFKTPTKIHFISVYLSFTYISNDIFINYILHVLFFIFKYIIFTNAVKNRWSTWHITFHVIWNVNS